MIPAQVKQGELLENPTPNIGQEDNQQPSLDSNIFEGSTTNNRVLTSKIEDSNIDTSALPIVIEKDKFGNPLVSVSFKIIDFSDDIV